MRASAIVWIGAALQFAVLTALAVVRTRLWTYGADEGTFVQVIASAFHGMHDGIERGTHFRFHWSPSLVVLWPVVAAFGGLGLQIVQAAATAVCAPLIFAIARNRCSERLALGLAFATLLYPPLLGVGFDEFHELGLFPAVALAMVLAAGRKRWGWFAICALFALGLREDVCIELAIFGAVLWRLGAKRDSRALAIAGGSLAAAAAATLAFYFLVLVPLLGGWRPAHFYDYAGGLSAVAPTLAGRFTYLLEAFAPLAFLPLRSRVVLLAIPGLAIVVLANSPDVWRMGTHYPALWIPWMLLAAVDAVASLARNHEPAVARRWTAGAIAACALFLIAFDPLHPLHYLHPEYSDLADARRALACVPKDASLATQDEWFSHVAASRPYASPAESWSTNQYFVYARNYPNPYFQHVIWPHVQSEVASGRYRVLCSYGPVAAYVRVSG